MAKQVRSGLDRISSLPDEILCHIISFLQPKDAVSTCILSKRWRYFFADLFASISSLDFDVENNWEGTVDAFMNFVDRLLLLNKRQYIDRFRLYISYEDSFDPLRVEGWIHSVLWRSIEEIDLSINLELPNGLPAGLFMSNTLVVLKLTWLSFQVPASVHLPRLKVFHIKSCFFDDDFGECLSTGCPVLEELALDAEFWCKLNVSNSMLKRLTIAIWNESGSVDIIINVPSLVYLHYHGYEGNHLAVINVPSLTEANICLCPCVFGDLSGYLTLATDLMEGISNIHALSISYETLDDLNERMVPLPSFQNLTYLCILEEYFVYEEKSFLGLHRFLSHSDFLETLVFKELPDECESIDWHQLEESRLPCLLFHLKTIEIFSFKGGEVQLEIIKYFLRNARVLENLTINISKEKKVQLKMIEENIHTFPRISEECQITIL